MPKTNFADIKHSPTIQMMGEVHDYIVELNSRLEGNLDPETEVLMAHSLTKFLEDSVEKFILGQKEHGGKITDRDLDTEIRKEIIDCFWYNSAKHWPGGNKA